MTRGMEAGADWNVGDGAEIETVKKSIFILLCNPN